MSTKRRTPIPVELRGGPVAGTMHLWPEDVTDELFLPDREHAKANPDSLTMRWHRYRRAQPDAYDFVATEESP